MLKQWEIEDSMVISWKVSNKAGFGAAFKGDAILLPFWKID